MKKDIIALRRILILFFLLSFFSPETLFAWGQTGHRVVGAIAEQYLSKKARKNIRKVLGQESLAMVGNYMDFIKSEPKFNYMKPWHYATIPDSMTYEEAGIPANGDILQAIEMFTGQIRNQDFQDLDEVFALKCLVHLVADIHQPMHVGNGKDKGGNDFRVRYFGKSSNLHRVWGSQMIDGQQLSYSEYALSLGEASKEQIKAWQQHTPLEWAIESRKLHELIYKMPESKRLSYRYVYENISTLNLRLLQAGVRLAGILKSLYG